VASQRDANQLVRKLRKLGYRVELRSGCHHWRAEVNGHYVSIPFSPSDRRSLLNVRAKLRRAGCEL